MTRSLVNRWRDAIRDSALDPTAKLVALIIATYFDSEGRGFPAKETIADGASFRSVRTADNAVDRLEQAGYLAIRRTAGRASNDYQAIIPTPHEAAGSTPHTDTGSTGHGGAGLGRGHPARDDRQPRISLHSTPHPGAGERLESVEQAPNGARLKGAAPVAIDICPTCGVTYTFPVGDEQAALGCPDCRAKARA